MYSALVAQNMVTHSRVSDQNGVSLLYIMLEIHILVGNPHTVTDFLKREMNL